MDSEELVVLENKWLLFDTSVLLRIAKRGDDIESPLVKLREKYSCIFSVHDLIVQEFLSYTIRQEAYNARLNLVQQYPSLPVSQKERELALHVSRIYAINKISSPSVVDCITAAFCKKYSKDVVLLTNDLKDFPTVLFDPIYIWPFDGSSQVDLFGFYKFSPGKMEKEEKKLESASK